MKRLIISESEKNNIRKMYGLINEQSIKNVPIQGKQPISNTDWDLVHGILGSKRIDDDLEKRVGDELQNGNYRVSKIYIKSKKIGNEIVTDASVDLIPVKQGQVPHKYFTTRGSIGADYDRRHDTQVQGLEDRLKSYYKSNKVDVFGPYIVKVEGTNYVYKQSFFAVEGNNSQQNQSTQQQVQQQETQPVSIQAKNLEELTQQVKTLSTNKKIDLETVDIDLDNFTFGFEPGETQIFKLVLTYNTPQDQQKKQFPSYNNVISKNPEYSPNSVLSGYFENNTRRFSVIALYPPKK